MPPPPMSHADRKARRKQIAEAVRSGKTQPEAARMFGVSRTRAVVACLEFGVLSPRKGGTQSKVDWAAVDWTQPVKEIARRVGVHYVTVYRHQRKFFQRQASAASAA